MTSHHSSRSARSGHGRPHSTHIAQHLRRASIIESRKAKAADRNAHAEQVRLRAAMNKAAPRVTSINTMERSLAAQKARERYLAQVKANCAEEVKRSKRVAEEQREKRAAEHLKLVEEMEERHAEAEKRKNLLQLSQRRPRTLSMLPAVDETTPTKQRSGYIWKPNTPAQAASIIQRAWRTRLWDCAVKKFTELELTVENIQKAKFDEVGELLNRDHVLSITANLLYCLGLRDMNDGLTQEKTIARTFLITFLVLGHPTYVLSKDSEQEQDLVKKAGELLATFGQAIDTSFTEFHAPDGPGSNFSESYSNFQAAFKAWRSEDASYMISGMVAQFVELDGIWQTVKRDSDGSVAQDYKEGIQHNQTLILARLKKLVGPDKAMKMIKDAIRTGRKARSKKKQVSKTDDKPRVALASNESTTTPKLHTEISDSRQAPTMADHTSTARSQLETSSLVPPNRVVTHELAINREWKIDADSKIALQDETISSISKELQQGLNDGLGEYWIPALAENIREKLTGLLRTGSSMHNLISEVLDPSMIANQVRHGSFSYEKFFAFMNTILPQLCAPVRDSEVESLASDPSEDPVKQLARIYFIIDIIRLDMLNFTLQQWAPALLKEAVGYESRCFEKELENSFPDKTLHWWQKATEKANDEIARRSLDNTLPNMRAAAANKVYMNGITDLAIGTEPLKIQEIPETLSLDTERFTRIRVDLLRIITVSSILLTAKNLLRRDVRSLWKAEAQRMWDLPYNASPSAFVSIVESRYALPPTTKQQLTGTIARLLIDAKDGQLTHPVTKVLLKKIRAHVLARLSASSAEERIRMSTTATEALGSGGLPEFVTRVSDMVTELGKVADVDRESHGEWYEKIAQRISDESKESHDTASASASTSAP